VSFFTNSFQVDVMDNDVVPWLHSRAFEFVMDLEVQDNVPGSLVLDHLLDEEKDHIKTV